MIRNSSNLSSAGSEIVSSSSSQRNKLFSVDKVPKKIITKSYKITNDTSIVDILNNNNNNETNNNINQNESNKKNNMINNKNKSFIINNEQLEESKKASLDISNIKYKDGYILKDPTNSNPGYGLWSIKPHIKEGKQKIQLNNSLPLLFKKVEQKNNNIIIKSNNNTNNIDNIKYNDNDFNYKYTKFIDNKEILDNNIKNKKIINKLSNKLNDLENKYMEALSNFQEKKFLCQNAIKMKKEYDKLLKNNTNEIKLIKDKSKEINSENKILEDALSNTRNEIDRLLNIMKSDKENMNKLKEEYEDRINKEEIERGKLNDIIKNLENKIDVLKQQTYKLDDSKRSGIEKLLSNNYNEFEPENSNKKDFEIKKLKEVILNLQIKICNLKKQINTNNIDMEKLNNILEYKNRKDEYQRMNINNLFNIVEENEMNSLKNNIILRSKNEIIKVLKGNKPIQNNDKIKIKKLPKSSSQSLLIKKNFYKL